MKQLSIAALAATAFTIFATGAEAQTIERVKMTDNDLSCQQIYGEIGQMDKVVTMASQQTAAAAATPVAGAAPTDPNVGGQVAGAVAQTALAATVAKTGGSFGGFGGFGGMFGGIAQQLVQGATAQQAANAGAAQQQAASLQQNLALQSQQAQGRKEHLTGLFLSKGCKMSDIQK
jgi:hypothetical protein